MSTISESNLPGVGRKFQIETLSGDRLIIVIHDDGKRELYHFERKNLNRPASVLTLSDGEARQIAGIVGGLTYVPKALPTSEIVLEDLVLEWFTCLRVRSAPGELFAICRFVPRQERQSFHSSNQTAPREQTLKPTLC